MILKRQMIIINTRIERYNELRENKLNVLGIFTDSENGVEYVAISTDGNNWMSGLIDILCEASGLRFYGMKILKNKLCLMLF